MTSNLIGVLREIPPSGPEGSEGLISSLLEALTGRHFRLASAGYQAGRDMTARIPNGNVIAVECKRYGKHNELDERALLGEMAQAAHSIPDLDLWVLVASREIGSRLFEELNKQAAAIGIGFFALSDADGEPGSLEVLCSNAPNIFLDHPAIRFRSDKDTLKNILAGFTQNASYSKRLSELCDYFVSPLVGYHNWRIEQNEGLLKSLASAQDARESYGQPINVAEPGVHVVPRTSLLTSISKWYAGWKDSHSILSVLGGSLGF